MPSRLVTGNTRWRHVCSLTCRAASRRGDEQQRSGKRTSHEIGPDRLRATSARVTSSGPDPVLPRSPGARLNIEHRPVAAVRAPFANNEISRSSSRGRFGTICVAASASTADTGQRFDGLSPQTPARRCHLIERRAKTEDVATGVDLAAERPARAPCTRRCRRRVPACSRRVTIAAVSGDVSLSVHRLISFASRSRAPLPRRCRRR